MPSDAHLDLPGLVRRIRRVADLSQRELATRAGVSKSAIAAAESGVAGLDVRRLAACAAEADLRLALVDGDGRELHPMAAGTVRDNAFRHFPAHLDTRRSDEDGRPYEPRRDRPETAFTFGRDRAGRDTTRARTGTPEDHHPFRAGDTPRERAAARRREQFRADAEERQRRLLAGELRGLPTDFRCACPPACEELDDHTGNPVHAPDCPCRCDVG